MKRKVSMTLDWKVVAALERICARRHESLSYTANEMLKLAIATATKASRDLSWEELEILRSVSERIVEVPASKETILREVKSKNPELYEKLKKLSECELNFLLVFA